MMSLVTVLVLLLGLSLLQISQGLKISIPTGKTECVSETVGSEHFSVSELLAAHSCVLLPSMLGHPGHPG